MDLKTFLIAEVDQEHRTQAFQRELEKEHEQRRWKAWKRLQNWIDDLRFDRRAPSRLRRLQELGQRMLTRDQALKKQPPVQGSRFQVAGYDWR